MKKVADALCVLTSFSIRTHFVEKAIRYSECGYHLFEDDSRFVELYAYTLLLTNAFPKAEAILEQTPHQSLNIALLRCRCAILLGLPLEEKKSRAREYLRFGR